MKRKAGKNGGIGSTMSRRLSVLGRALLAAVLLMQVILWQTAPQAHAAPMSGSGTSADPYVITEQAHLNDVRNDLDAFYKLGNDIVLSGNWTPIGSDMFSPFKGSFDGGGHTIQGLRIESDASYAGLFGYIGPGGVVENVVLEEVDVKSTGFSFGSVGSLAGESRGTIRNVQVTGSVDGSGGYPSYVGGLVGSVDTGAVIENSTTDVEVKGASFTAATGGLVGKLSGGSVSGSEASADVSGNNNVGGLIGHAENAAITGSTASGDVSGNSSIGGLIGYAKGTTTITESAASGHATGDTSVGGLVGHAENTAIIGSTASGDANGNTAIGGLIGHAENANISGGAASGRVTGGSQIGGLVGKSDNTTIRESFAGGSVADETSGFNTGGLVGDADGGSITDSYSAAAVSGMSGLGGLIGGTSGPITVTNAHAVGTVHYVFWNSGGLINYIDTNATFVSSYYDKDRTGMSDSGGIGAQGKSTADMAKEETFAGWDFAAIWMLDDRDGYPTLQRFDTRSPAVKSAVVPEANPDRLVLTFTERVTALQDAIDALAVEVDGVPIGVTGYSGSGTRTITLELAGAVSAGQTVTAVPDAAHAMADLKGNALPADPIPVTNESLLAALDDPVLLPVNGAVNVSTGTMLQLQFEEPVTAMPGKAITIRRAIDGKASATIQANDASKVTVGGASVTIAPGPLDALTTYYVEIEQGAFAGESGGPSRAIAGSAAWRWTTDAPSGSEWRRVGSLDFSPGSASHPSLVVENGTVYAAFRHKPDGSLTVMKHAPGPGAWSAMGVPGMKVSAGETPALAVANGKLYVAFADAEHDGKATLLAFDGSDWQPVGSRGFSAGEAKEITLAVESGTPYVAYSDGANEEKATVMRYDSTGGAWDAVGPEGFTSREIYYPSLAINQGKLYLGFQDYGSDSFGASVFVYDDATETWAPLGGQGFTPSVVFDVTVAAYDGHLYAAFEDETHRAEVRRYDAGSDRWIAVGNAPFSAGQAYEMSFFLDDGIPYAAYRDAANGDKLTVMKYTGSSWVPVGAAGITSGAAFDTALFVENGVPYAAYVGSPASGGKVSVMSYALPVNEAPQASGVRIEGQLAAGAELTGVYTYADDEGDPEGASTYRWYITDDAAGKNKTAITGANQTKLTVDAEWAGRYLTFEVTPVASTGTASGLPVESAAAGPIAAVDATPPSIVSYSPAQHAQDVSVLTDLALTFDEVVTGTAGKYIYVMKASDDSFVDAIAADDTERVTQSDRMVTIALENPLAYGTAYYVVVEAGAFTDGSGNPFAGIAGSTGWPFVTEQAPLTPPDAPTGLTAAAGDRSVSLDWSDSVGASYYEVYIGTTSGQYGEGPAWTGTQSAYTFTGLENGQTYYFAVAAGNAAGKSVLSSEVSAVPEAAAVPSSNADLSGLTISAGTLSPAFEPSRLVYAANVAYGITQTTVTPIAQHLGAVIRVNGQPAVSGVPFGPVQLAVGTNVIEVVSTAQDGVTVRTYTIVVTRAADSGNQTPSQPTPSQPDTQQPGFPIIVNGSTQGSIASAVMTEAGERTSIDVAIDARKLAERLEAEDGDPSVIIPIDRAVDRATVAITGDAVRRMEERGAVLDIRTPLGSYVLPAGQAFVDRIAERIGESAQLDKLVVQVEIAISSDHRRRQLEEASARDGFEAVTVPIAYEVTMTYDGMRVETLAFNSFVRREIPLPAGTSIDEITTAVVIESNGTVRHVPTYVTMRDGIAYAVVNSLTNSDYALISRKASFADVRGHWAETAINELASRLAASGIDERRFEPGTAITRGEFVSLLVKALGLPTGPSSSFADLRHAGAIAQAEAYGIVRGDENGAFHPERTLTRQEAMVMLANAMKLAGLEPAPDARRTALSAYRDLSSLKPWGRPAAVEAVAAGLIHGSDGLLRPNGTLTRAESAVMVHRLLVQAGLIDGDKQ